MSRTLSHMFVLKQMFVLIQSKCSGSGLMRPMGAEQNMSLLFLHVMDL